MVMAKLLTVKGFSEESLNRTMFMAWNMSREVTFRQIKNNLFMVHASYVGDPKCIMEDGPGCSVIVHGCLKILLVRLSLLSDSQKV
jgi:hypothetical protein